MSHFWSEGLTEEERKATKNLLGIEILGPENTSNGQMTTQANHALARWFGENPIDPLSARVGDVYPLSARVGDVDPLSARVGDVEAPRKKSQTKKKAKK